MKMKMDMDLTKIRAEFLLCYLYGEEAREWVAEYRGSFTRNYQGDIVELDSEQKRVTLSRDSLLKLLPESMFDESLFNNETKGKRRPKGQKSKQDRAAYERLSALFSSIDNQRFQLGLGYEREFAQIIEERRSLLLREFYGYDTHSESDPYVARVSHLLLHRETVKGDMPLIGEILSALLGVDVEMSQDQYFANRWSRSFLPRVIYRLHWRELRQEELIELRKSLTPLFEFVREWFIPMEVVAEFRFADFEENEENEERHPLLLGYNTKIGKGLNNE